MIHITEVEIKHDGDREEYTATISYCEPAPGLLIQDPIHGTGETLSEALRNLAEQLELVNYREDVLV